jgi:hypothetical protein
MKKCRQTAFLFSKLAVASVRCNFPDNDAVRRSLAVFLGTAQHFCGKGQPSSWPGAKNGAMALYREIKKQGELAVTLGLRRTRGRVRNERREGLAQAPGRASSTRPGDGRSLREEIK